MRLMRLEHCVGKDWRKNITARLKRVASRMGSILEIPKKNLFRGVYRPKTFHVFTSSKLTN